MSKKKVLPCAKGAVQARRANLQNACQMLSFEQAETFLYGKDSDRLWTEWKTVTE